MIIILKNNYDDRQLSRLTDWMKTQNIEVHFSRGTRQTILGLIGDTSHLDMDLIGGLDIVDGVRRIAEPYKNANRKFHPDDTVITLPNGAKLGGGNFQIIAGPCSVESYEQIELIAREVAKSGVRILRGGAFKPRTSPYSFQGLRGEGIAYLLAAKKATGLALITEIMDIGQLPLFDEIDIIQVGARNMQNFELLKELGTLRKPILLKRGLANTLEELLMSAEYIMAGGNEQVILCERGIRTFERATRNTLDISAVPMLKKLSHLPVIVDPSHATGIAELVPPLALAATAAGTDGLMIEVHNNPALALCDGKQSLTCERFAEIAAAVERIRPFAWQRD